MHLESGYPVLNSRRRLPTPVCRRGSLSVPLVMQPEDRDDSVNKLFKRPETEKRILEVADLCKLKCVQGRLPTLADIEVTHPRLNEKVVFSHWLRRQAVRYIRRKQENPFKIRCPTCKQEVDRFDFVQIQGGLMRYFFNISNDDLQSAKSNRLILSSV